MMTGIYNSYAQPISHEMLFDWHQKLMVDNRQISDVGRYRTHTDAMQVVSDALHKLKVHYEAPPSEHMQTEMDAFIAWFNSTAPNGATPLSALTRAGIARFYFVYVHPFEDGNGRIGRALVLKALCQNVKQLILLALSYTIQNNKRAYYEALQKNNQTLKITSWQTYPSHLF